MKDYIEQAIALLSEAEKHVLHALAETEDVEVELALEIQASEIRLQRIKLIRIIGLKE